MWVAEETRDDESNRARRNECLIDERIPVGSLYIAQILESNVRYTFHARTRVGRLPHAGYHGALQLQVCLL